MRPTRAPVRLSHLTAFMVAGLIVGCDADVPSEPTTDVSASQPAAKPTVQPICHFDVTLGRYIRLDLVPPASTAHRNHGDAAPGDPFPGPAGFIFDDACQPEEIAIAELEQLSPVIATYEAAVFSGSGEGEVTGNVIAVDINVAGNRLNTSGCEAADFAGLDFSGSNDIALIQRSGCLFSLTAGNAKAAGAEAVIVFNQGNTPDREGVVNGDASADGTITHDIPVIGASFAAGVALSQPGSTARVRTQIPD